MEPSNLNQSIKYKITESVKYIKENAHSLDCISHYTQTTDTSVLVMIHEQNLRECNKNLLTSLGYLSYVVMQNFCNDHKTYHQVIKELGENKKFDLEVHQIENTDAALLTFFIIENSYKVTVTEFIEDSDHNFATAYCSGCYIIELGLYDDFEKELTGNYNLYNHTEL